MADVESEAVSGVVKGRLPRYPLPVALIGRLAVHVKAQGRGVGGRLLRDALRRVLDASRSIGCLGVIVDAKDESAQGFYEKFGFVVLKGSTGWPRRMFLSLATLKKSAGGPEA
jgi:ribosomal protein S18 acetylase RimI-like enzyme